MDREQKMVQEFMQAFGQTTNEHPTVVVSYKDRELGITLIEDELAEYKKAVMEDDIVEIADALADLIYVIKWAASLYGIDNKPIFDEVHRSNMTKVGGHKDESGKWVKPDSYSKADLKPILIAQGWEG